MGHIYKVTYTMNSEAKVLEFVSPIYYRMINGKPELAELFRSEFDRHMEAAFGRVGMWRVASIEIQSISYKGYLF